MTKLEQPARVILLLIIWLVWWWAFRLSPSPAADLCLIVGGILLVFPLVWLGRKLLDQHPTLHRAEWTTTFVHFSLGLLFGIPLIRLILLQPAWPGWRLPIPPAVGLVLSILSGAAFLLTVVNLALKGSGAPFFIALSERLAVDWLYAWTRNPMVLAALALLLSLGLWFRSALFLLWVVLLFTPALLFFIKVFEERELEIRFGSSYLDYKSRTPMLIPRKPMRQEQKKPGQ